MPKKRPVPAEPVKDQDDISFLLENGMSFGEIQEFMRNDISLPELRSAVASRLARGLPGTEDPEEERTDQRPALTMEGLEAYLRDRGVRVRYNMISKEVEIGGVPEQFNPESLAADVHVILHDLLKREFKCTKDQVADLLHVLAGVGRYNPVEELLAGASWDGRDRMGELFAILHLPQGDTLSRILIAKWLSQCVAMARNQLRGAYGAEGVLVLTGPQGIGKTTLVKALGMRRELYKLGQWLDTRDKDTFRRCTSAWLVELGELETTLRSDLERLKAFITAERDEYRLPYGRADQVLARRTSFVATCNSGRFLIDPSGSRRFWTVPVEEIDLEGLGKLDVLQLWKQAEAALDRDGQCFRLTASEQKALAKRNTAHEKPLRGQMEVEDILAEAREDPGAWTWTEMTVSDFKAGHSLLHPYSVEQIGRVLDKLGIERKRGMKDGKHSKLRRLPAYRYKRESGTVRTG